MKKVILLLILQLTVLMAADFTMSKSGTLTKEGTTTPAATEPVAPITTEPVIPVTTEPVPTVPASESGIIPDSVDQIWADMNEANTGWASATNAGQPQFQGAFHRNPADLHDFEGFNIWTEVELAGNGTSCSPYINKAVNTAVEIGYTRGWWLDQKGAWHPMNQLKVQNEWITIPRMQGGTPYNERRDCSDTAYPLIYQERMNNYLTYTPIKGLSASGFRLVRPDHYFRYHGWNSRTIPSNPDDVKAVFGQIYFRLVLIDPNGIDDRDKAEYIVHIASDRFAPDMGRTLGTLSISRYKKVTKDWVSINILSDGITKAQLTANPPPFSLVP